MFHFAQPQQTKSRPTYIIASSRNSCLPTTTYPVKLKKITEDILHKIYARCNHWHMISFIRFPSGNKLADAREGGG